MNGYNYSLLNSIIISSYKIIKYPFFFYKINASI